MRHLFFLLLLANGVFFLWEKYVSPGFDAIDNQARNATKLDRIVLIGELSPVPALTVTPPMATTEQSAAMPSPTAPPVQKTPPMPALRDMAAHTGKPEQAVSVSVAIPLEVNTQATANKQQAKPESEPSGSDAGKLPAIAAKSNNAAPDAPSRSLAPKTDNQEAAHRQCRRIGPFLNEADANSLRQRLVSGGELAALESAAGNVESGYYVLYPPAGGLDAARANRAMIIQKGASDASVLTSGEYARAVSLGYFKERARAEKLLTELRAKGLVLQIKPRNDQRQEFWLKWQGGSAADLDARLKNWRVEHPGQSVHDSACP